MHVPLRHKNVKRSDADGEFLLCNRAERILKLPRRSRSDPDDLDLPPVQALTIPARDGPAFIGSTIEPVAGRELIAGLQT